MIIDQLPLLGGDVQGTDEIPIERGTTTYKTTQAALIKEAIEKGLPSGGTAGQVLTKADSSDYSASWEDPSGGDVTADMIGIVITGNSTPVGASVGQYVIVKNSTISGITDGLYTAKFAIPANTAIDSTYLTAVSGGGLNDLIKTSQYSNSAVATPNPSASISYNYCKGVTYGKIGMVSINFVGTYPSVASSGVLNIGQLNQDLIPKAAPESFGTISANGADQSMSFTITDTGQINIYAMGSIVYSNPRLLTIFIIE